MNLIFVVAHTFRADNLACYGSKEVKTPNLDPLAEESVVHVEERWGLLWRDKRSFEDKAYTFGAFR